MAIACEFEYFKPKNLGEALRVLSRYGKRAGLLAGGTDLLVRIKDGLETPDAVIDIKGIKELKRLEFKNKRLFMGALVTFSEILDSKIVREKFAPLWEASKTVASTGIRNRATIVGNICSAVPSLDSGPALLLYEADVHIKGPRGMRKLPISKWFLGPKKNALRNGEIAVGISLPLPEKRHSGCYVKLGRYKGEDLAQAGVCVFAFPENRYGVAFCAVAPVPKRSERIESFLNGKEITDSLIEDAKSLIPGEISPITDIRATKGYRLHMVKVMFERAIKAAVARLKGEGPEYGASLI